MYIPGNEKKPCCRNIVSLTCSVQQLMRNCCAIPKLQIFPRLHAKETMFPQQMSMFLLFWALTLYPSCFPYCSELINRISVLIVWSVNLTIDTKLSLSFLGCRKSFLVVLTMWFTYGMPLARLASEEQSITLLDLCTL